MRTQTHDRSRPLPARRRVWAYGAVAVVVVALIAMLSVGPLLSGRSEVRTVQRDDQALRQVLDLRGTFAEFQLFLEPEFAKFTTTATAFAPTEIAAASQIVQTAIAQTQVATATLNTMASGPTPAPSPQPAPRSRNR